MPKEKSKCCNADVKVISGDEGTSYYQCLKCNQPTDLQSYNFVEDDILAQQSVQEVEYGELDRLLTDPNMSEGLVYLSDNDKRLLVKFFKDNFIPKNK